VVQDGRPIAWSDSTRLAESDSAFVAQPGGLHVGPGGELLVSDAVNARVFVFESSGVLRQIVGARGRGPGELLSPSAVAILGGDRLIVVDNATARLNQFSLADGSYLGAVRLPGAVTDIRAANDGVWLASAQFESGRSHASWKAGTDVMTHHGNVPEAYERFPRLRRNLGHGTLALAPDGLWVGMMGTNSLELFADAGDTVASRSVEIRRERRRGVPLDNSAMLASEMSYEDEVQSVSALVASGALTDGRIATVHLDLALKGETVERSGFLSLVDGVTGRGCVDLPVTIASEVMPVFRFEGDALYSVDSRPAADGSPQTWVRRFDLSALRC